MGAHSDPNQHRHLFAPYLPDKPVGESMDLGARLAIRPAKSRDVEGLASICFDRDGGTLDAHAERLRKEVAEHPWWQDRLLLVAVVDDCVVGFGRAVYFEPPADSPPNVVPSGWYLGGTIVAPTHRRLGIGLELTGQRLDWVAERADKVFYTVSAQNQASIDLHSRFHFKELSRDISFPGSSFTGGVGLLFGLNRMEHRNRTRGLSSNDMGAQSGGGFR